MGKWSDPEEKEARRQQWEMMTQAQREKKKRTQVWECLKDPNFNKSIVERARKRMERVDAMSADMRAVVHDNGLEVVSILVDHRLDAQKSRWLIDLVRNADRPHSKQIISGAMSLGFTEKKAIFLIDTILGADYENGQPRFKINKGPSAKQNPLSHDDDDEAYYICGPSVTGT